MSSLTIITIPTNGIVGEKDQRCEFEEYKPTKTKQVILLVSENTCLKTKTFK